MLNAIRPNSMQFTAAQGSALRWLVSPEFGPSAVFPSTPLCTYRDRSADRRASRPVEVAATTAVHALSGWARTSATTRARAPGRDDRRACSSARRHPASAPIASRVFDVGEVSRAGGRALARVRSQSLFTLAYAIVRRCGWHRAPGPTGRSARWVRPRSRGSSAPAMGVMHPVAVSLNTSIRRGSTRATEAVFRSPHGPARRRPARRAGGGPSPKRRARHRDRRCGLGCSPSSRSWSSSRPLDESLEETERIRADALLTTQPAIAGAG
jgi:hypothetical protein